MVHSGFFLLFQVLLLSFGRAGSDGKCRGIIFQGTGDRGAYEAGAFSGLVSSLPAEDVKYDIVGATGFGVINALVLASYPVGSESEAASKMVEVWGTLNQEDVYKNWAFGISEGFFFESGLYNNGPFTKYMKDLLNSTGSAQRMLHVVATNFNNGRLFRFNETSLTPDVSSVFIGASACPIMFPYVTYNGMTLVDGSVINSLDIGGVIDRCNEAGYTDENVIIDIVMTQSDKTTQKNISDFNALRSLGRLVDIYTYSLAYSSLIRTRTEENQVDFRHIVKPTELIANIVDPYEFNNEEMKKDIQRGQKDAQEAVNKDSFGETIKEAEELVKSYRPGKFRKNPNRAADVLAKKVIDS